MKICVMHRFPIDQIKETNASIHYLLAKGAELKSFKTFNRMSPLMKMLKSVIWILYAPMLVFGKNYDVIYCDDSFPFYPYLVKLSSPRSKVVIRLGDFHLMYHCPPKYYNFFHKLEIKVWQKVDMIIAISQTMATKIQADSGVKAEVVLDPVDLTDFDVSWCPLVGNQKRIMFHGTITKNKGLHRLLESAKQLPQHDFYIIGDGEYRKHLKSIAPRNVTFIGWMKHSEIKHMLSTADVGIAIRGFNMGNEYVVTSPWLQYSVLGVPCAVSKRKVFSDISYPYQFESTHELVELIKKLTDKPKSWQTYVKRHHDARKVASKIWSLLLS